MHNLIDNAAKFAKPGEALSLEVDATQQNGRWVLKVKDDGVGFPAARASQVFEIFQRLNNTGEVPGTGIGLAHCRKVARLHNGDIWAESVAGHGAVFYVALPVEGALEPRWMSHAA